LVVVALGDGPDEVVLLLGGKKPPADEGNAANGRVVMAVEA
jgi:hypothetical protein